MKLICPSDNWKEPIEIDDKEANLLQETAKRLGLPFNYNKAQNKLYLGKKQAVLAAEFVCRFSKNAVSTIIDGVLMLGGQEYKACSGAPGCQVYGQYFSKGAPIPPGDYEIDLDGYYCSTTGIEGRFYHILPDPIWNADKTKKRTEIGLHRDAGSPGTAGCIGIVGDDFSKLDAVLRALYLSQKTLPLKVRYLCRD